MIDTIYRKIELYKVVPVVAIDEVDNALPLADALIEGGLPLVEITFRTAAAAAVIEVLRKNRPELLVGAGTILTVDHLHKACACGAAFGVAPGFNPKIAEAALKMGFPFAPGIMTPSELENVLSLGIAVMKFFPAEAAGGMPYLKSIHAPYAHTGVRFMPTGGINKSNAANYLALDAVLAVGGTWIAPRDTIAGRNWPAITQNCREIVSILKHT
jgi:2-dehydro-3-deoxyphosphogluconate aldolase/(4S)-4-hydroxy-2-oxoglutarate aldolase